MFSVRIDFFFLKLKQAISHLHSETGAFCTSVVECSPIGICKIEENNKPNKKAYII